MCRGFQENEREVRLKIKAFYTHLLSNNKTVLPDYLTLHFLPRINGSLLEINGSSVRPDSPGFATLHRVLSNERRGLLYGCRERVVVCEGARFQIYAGDVKLLKGVFRKDQGQNWKMDCKCVLSASDAAEWALKDAEVSVAAEGPVVINQKVRMAAERRRRRRCCELEEIPEEIREGESGSDVCWCSECSGVVEEMDGGDCEVEVEMEGVRWALDVGVWVVCVGVGYLVCRASSSKRKRFI